MRRDRQPSTMYVHTGRKLRSEPEAGGCRPRPSGCYQSFHMCIFITKRSQCLTRASPIRQYQHFAYHTISKICQQKREAKAVEARNAMPRMHY